MSTSADKNETTRFLGDGVSFKAKLIGILEVSEARGDRMCQEALSDLKMAIRAAGEHKQRITINIAIDGLRLRDEKTGDSLYHHPVHKISFIAQDMTDSRAFGYIFGSPDTGHRFFGIKTDKAASQVVIAMRDLFQVVFALKKKEIELAKQHLDKSRFTSSSLFSDTSASSVKAVIQESMKSVTSENKTNASSDIKPGGTAVADLVDLELELNSLQQGLNQMERITPSDPFASKDDPFGDSFTSYTKPILPPPPSSGKERSSRTSETSSVFSPRTPHTMSNVDTSCGDASLIVSKDLKSKREFNFSSDFSSSHDEPSSGDWFTPSAASNIFEEPPLVPEPTKDEKYELTKHEMTNQEILSQFDVFTELDPLELKNPPKKILNDMVSQPQQQQQETSLFNKTVPQNLTKSTGAQPQEFTTDPFGEDPFITEDPFAEADFSKQDPFETEFVDLKSKSQKLNDLENIKFEAKFHSENLQLVHSNISRSPKNSVLEKQMSLIGTSPRNAHFNKQNTFDTHFDKRDSKKDTKLLSLHEHPSLDMSSESECAPEPPPRPASSLIQIKPPPLPPKKQPNDLSVKPPPRPPHSEELHYNYMEETAPNSLEFIKKIDKSPPLPVPVRKSKFESDFNVAPERPNKQLNVNSSEEDYLSPVSFLEHKGDLKYLSKNSAVLLPPPQKSTKKQNTTHVTVASYLEFKPNLTTSTATDNLNSSVEGLDITLSQLTLSGLNELATKLNIPTNQLSNMTLVQLTNYLSNFIKSKTALDTSSNNFYTGTNSNSEVPFKADFAANFDNVKNNTAMESTESYDRYAVFRELINEEIKQTKIDTEPEELKEEKIKLPNSLNSNINNIYATTTGEPDNTMDKYAALREIVESELLSSGTEQKESNNNENIEDSIQEKNVLNEEVHEKSEEPHIVITENKYITDKKEEPPSSKYNIVENSTPSETKDVKLTTAIRSPKSPVDKMIKSPVPVALTEIVQSNARLTSGSLSDVVSGSSPDVDNTTSNFEAEKKVEDTAGESWAIFDQSNVLSDLAKEKQAVQSEEGISPWSSDSKEFGNGSPPDWRRRDSGSGGEHWPRRRVRRDQEGWWDTSAEPEAQYYPSNRRSTDSYEEEYYECHEKPRRRKQTSYIHGSQAAGGHSSSSRDVSPWEEEPRHREIREQRVGWSKHAKPYSFEKPRDRRQTASWDDEDDYEYEEEHTTSRFHRSDRQTREIERERYKGSIREHDLDRWRDEWNDERRYRRRREGERDRRCCPDWDHNDHDKSTGRYGGGRWPHIDVPLAMRRDRKHDERYYSRESQESPWDDDYSNDADEVLSPQYLTAKRNWKRPSSASEMDRTTGEIKSRHYLGTGGSDGERDRRYKPGRRSRSRDSQCSEPSHRHKDVTTSLRPVHRSKQYSKSQFDEFIEVPSKKQVDISKLDYISKKSATMVNRKKSKEGSKLEEHVVSTFPRKSSSFAKSLFENDFVPSEDYTRVEGKINFENDLETSESESPTLLNKPTRGIKQLNRLEKSTSESEFTKENFRQKSLKELKLSPHLHGKSKSLFEDDFSPSDKPDTLPEDNSISSIKEEIGPNEAEDSFSTSNFENATNSRRKKLNKYRLSNNIQSDVTIKKSESVNIFARESDPFDDDFFSENIAVDQTPEYPMGTGNSPRTTDLKWTDDFEEDENVEKNK